MVLLFSVSASAADKKSSAPKVAEDAILKARTLETLGDRAGAIRILEARLRIDPDDSRALLLCGTLYSWQGKVEEADERLVRIPPSAKERSEARRILTRIALQRSDPDRAYSTASGEIIAGRKTTLLLLDRARASIWLGHLAEARADLAVTQSVAPEESAQLMARIEEITKTQAELDLRWSKPTPLREWPQAVFDALPAVTKIEALKAGVKPSFEDHPVKRTDILEYTRALAKRGDRASALQVLSWHLEANFGDTDARTLYATILSWEGSFDEARKEVAVVLAASPGHYDATRAAIRVEMWTDHPKAAEELATKGLVREKDSVDLLLARAHARTAAGDAEGAKEDVAHVLSLEPNNEEALKMKSTQDALDRVWAVGGNYTLDAFSDGRKPWHEATLQGKRITKIGSVFARVYQAWRFETTDHQLELEFFPKIREGTYADMAIAASPNADLYPKYRLQFDFYQSLPLGLEASLGYRRIQFGSAVDMGVITLSKYLGPWFFTVRSFLTSAESKSLSLHLSARRYFLDGDLYVGLRYGYGLSKEEIARALDSVLLTSNTLAAEGAIVLDGRWDIGLRASMSQDARPSADDLWQYTIGMSVGYRF